MMPDYQALAAAVVVAVADNAHDDAHELIDRLHRNELQQLVVFLADHVDPDRPFAERGTVTVGLVNAVIRRTARRFNTTPAVIKSSSRRREDVIARHVACYAARLCGASFPTIGKAVGRDHTSAMHACASVGEKPALRRAANAIATDIGRRPLEDIDDDDTPSDPVDDQPTPPRRRPASDFDEAVVQRILAGEWRLPSTKAEREAVVARFEGSHNQLERLTGWKIDRYKAAAA